MHTLARVNSKGQSRGKSSNADFEAETTADFGFAFYPTVIMTPNKKDLFKIHEALQTIKEKHGDDSTIGIHHSLDLFSLKQYESKKAVLKRIHDKLIKDRDIIEISMGTRRYRKLRRLVEAKPFDERHIPDNLLKRCMAEDQYLLLICSPADKNYFDV